MAEYTDEEDQDVEDWDELDELEFTLYGFLYPQEGYFPRLINASKSKANYQGSVKKSGTTKNFVKTGTTILNLKMIHSEAAIEANILKRVPLLCGSWDVLRS